MFYILLQATRPNAGSRNQDSLLLGQFKIPHLIVNEFPVPITGVREGFTLRYSGQGLMASLKKRCSGGVHLQAFLARESCGQPKRMQAASECSILFRHRYTWVRFMGTSLN